jgi:hypothetical protein
MFNVCVYGGTANPRAAVAPRKKNYSSNLRRSRLAIPTSPLPSMSKEAGSGVTAEVV